jgi:hypothetical protein
MKNCFTWFCLGIFGVSCYASSLVCWWDAVVEGKISGILDWWFRGQCNFDTVIEVVPGTLGASE